VGLVRGDHQLLKSNHTRSGLTREPPANFWEGDENVTQRKKPLTDDGDSFRGEKSRMLVAFRGEKLVLLKKGKREPKTLQRSTAGRKNDREELEGKRRGALLVIEPF